MEHMLSTPQASYPAPLLCLHGIFLKSDRCNTSKLPFHLLSRLLHIQVNCVIRLPLINTNTLSQKLETEVEPEKSAQI